MMKTKLFFLAICLAFSTQGWSQDYDACVDGIYYNFSGTNAEVIPSLLPDNPLFSQYSGTIVIPAQIVVDAQTYDVTSIGSGAFLFSPATSVSLPESITEIKPGAFTHCSLESIVIPNSVETIGERAFNSCEQLKSAVIGTSVESIGISAFSYCNSLKSVTILSNLLETIEGGTFSYSGLSTINIPNSVTIIRSNAFTMCGLSSLNIPNSVTTIEAYAFYRTNLSLGVFIPASVTSIEMGAFSNSKAYFDVDDSNLYYSSEDGFLYNKDKTTLLQCFGGKVGAFTVPGTVTTLGGFGGCDRLTSITIPKSVTTIGGNLFFYAYSSLNEIIVEWDAPIRELTHYDFLDGMDYLDTDKLKNITLYVPAGKKAAYESANGWNFFQIEEKTSAEVDGIYYNFLGTNAEVTFFPAGYSQGSSLRSTEVNYSGNITIPSQVSYSGNTYQVTRIGDSAFEDCNELTSVAIPESVTHIGSKAFANCTDLTSVSVEWETPLEISSSVFSGVDFSDCTLYVPKGTESDYQSTAVWQNFSTQEVGTVTPIELISSNVGITIYPNPATDKINIVASDTHSIKKISLINLQGQLIKSANANDTEMNISNLPVGTYLLKVETIEGDIIEKIIKQ